MNWIGLTVAAALLAPANDPTVPSVRDSSFTAADGTRTMRLSLLIHRPPRRVWRAISTEQGWKSWGVQSAFVDFRQGGMIETSYRPDAPKGDRDNIRNLIIDFVPERLLVFRNVQAPRKFPADTERFSRVITTIKLAPAKSGTIVSISGAGYGADGEYQRLYEFFRRGNAYSLEQLRDTVERDVQSD